MQIGAREGSQDTKSYASMSAVEIGKHLASIGFNMVRVGPEALPPTQERTAAANALLMSKIAQKFEIEEEGFMRALEQTPTSGINKDWPEAYKDAVLTAFVLKGLYPNDVVRDQRNYRTLIEEPAKAIADIYTTLAQKYPDRLIDLLNTSLVLSEVASVNGQRLMDPRIVGADHKAYLYRAQSLSKLIPAQLERGKYFMYKKSESHGFTFAYSTPQFPNEVEMDRSYDNYEASLKKDLGILLNGSTLADLQNMKTKGSPNLNFVVKFTSSGEVTPSELPGRKRIKLGDS